VTTIGYGAAPVELCGCRGADLDLDAWSRLASEFEIVDCNTIVAVHRVLRTFAFDQNPLTDEGEVIGEGFGALQFSKVPVKVSDLGEGKETLSAISCDKSCSSSSSSSSSCSSDKHHHHKQHEKALVSGVKLNRARW
jgi:hypothetical protein